MRCLIALACIMPLTAYAQQLPPLKLVQEEVTVSGLSSGGAMAVQLQTAFSSRITGAGIVAGAPFGCAEGRWFVATGACMQQRGPSVTYPPTVERIANVVESVSAVIDPVEGLADDRVYLFHGTKDETVSQASMELLRDVLGHFGVPETQVDYDITFEALHGFLTEESNNACLLENDSYLNDCDVDMAGEILRYLGLVQDENGEEVSDNLRSFDQAPYFAAENGSSMSETGYVYIPAACEVTGGEPCRLHIVLHGCLQGETELGDTFPRTAGYNSWAEENHIVVLYPQVGKSFLNPGGCWDWWGYSTGSTQLKPNLDYLGKDAPQMATIAAMAAALGAPLTD